MSGHPAPSLWIQWEEFRGTIPEEMGCTGAGLHWLKGQTCVSSQVCTQCGHIGDFQWATEVGNNYKAGLSSSEVWSLNLCQHHWMDAGWVKKVKTLACWRKQRSNCTESKRQVQWLVSQLTANSHGLPCSLWGSCGFEGEWMFSFICLVANQFRDRKKGKTGNMNLYSVPSKAYWKS